MFGGNVTAVYLPASIYDEAIRQGLIDRQSERWKRQVATPLPEIKTTQRKGWYRQFDRHSYN